ncbi:MAG: hypothetical protein HQM11_07585 [SAR324 cluster bacterium]|nr:hypothetical protein [SAR324 cluster bacterium]
MIISVIREKRGHNSTLGKVYVDGEFQCFSLEDEYRKEKKAGETRIPGGVYPLAFRKEGGFYAKYCKMFNGEHPILWIKDVPGFEWIYFHIGNYHTDTDGCILLGDGYTETFNGSYYSHTVLSSKSAYTIFYEKVSRELKLGNAVSVAVIDFDRSSRMV